MPTIGEQELVDLYSELDKLKEENKKLEEGFIDLKLKHDEVKTHNNQKKVAVLLLLLLFIGVGVFAYFNYNKMQTKNKAMLDKQNALLDRQVTLLDSIKQIKDFIPEEYNADVVYSIQLGVFKKLDIEFGNKKNVALKKIVTENGNAYQLGSFLSYKTATAFKNEIKKIGLKDVFLVPYDKDKQRIDIKEALILSDEQEFIKD